MFGGTKPTKAPRGDGTGYKHIPQTHRMKQVIKNLHIVKKILFEIFFSKLVFLSTLVFMYFKRLYVSHSSILDFGRGTHHQAVNRENFVHFL